MGERERGGVFEVLVRHDRGNWRLKRSIKGCVRKCVNDVGKGEWGSV